MSDVGERAVGSTGGPDTALGRSAVLNFGEAESTRVWVVVGRNDCSGVFERVARLSAIVEALGGCESN